MDQIEIKLPDLSRVALEPGDVLLVRTQRSISMQDAHDIRERLRMHFPDNDAVVLGPGVELAVVRPLERAGAAEAQVAEALERLPYLDGMAEAISRDHPIVGGTLHRGIDGIRRVLAGPPSRDNGPTTPNAPTED